MADTGNITMPTSCLGELLERMKLTHLGDAALLPAIQQWIRGQRPGLSRTTVLSVSLVAQRLARAFACRGTNAAAAAPPKATATTTANPTPTPPSAATTTNPTLPVASNPTGVPPTASTAAAASSSTNKKTKKKKSFRSVKKLDLSPKVANSLKGFVADLASCTPLIVKQVEYEQYRDDPLSAMMGRNPKAITAVEALELCLRLLESESATPIAPTTTTIATSTSTNPKHNKNNAAMDLFRNVLAAATQKQQNPDGTYSSTMDELKFKTFGLKVLECAIAHAILVTESFYDFQLVSSTAQSAIAVDVIPRKGSSADKSLWLWKLACYRVWRNQEEHPQLCTRQQRLLATTVSMVLLATLPLMHRHPDQDADARQKQQTQPQPQPHPQPPATPSSTSPEATSNANMELNKRPAPPGELAGEEANSAKIQKISESGGVAAGISTQTSHTKQSPATPWRPHANCSYCQKQELAIYAILNAHKQAASFLEWAVPEPESSQEQQQQQQQRQPSNKTLSRNDLDAELNKVMRDLACFSSIPPMDYTNETVTSNAWVDMLQNAIGLRDHSHMTIRMAESELFQILEKAFTAMRVGEDERKGTRVEAVQYVPESILAEGEVWQYMEYLCPTVRSRRKRDREMVACIPFINTALKSKVSSGSNTMMSTSATPAKSISAPVSGSSSAFQTVEQQKSTASSPAMNPHLAMVGEAHNKLISTHRAVSPPVVTESMELNEWTIAVLSSLTVIRPTPSLRKRLDAAAEKANEEANNTPKVNWTRIVVPLLNRFLARMRHAASGPSSAPLPLVVDAEGEVHTTKRTHDTQLWAAILQLYYHSLEAILFSESERLENASANAKLVMSDSFHEALIACSYLCIARAVQFTGKIPMHHPESHQIYSILPIAGCSSYTYLKVTESFLRALTTTLEGDETSKKLTEIFGILPRLLQKEVKNSEVNVIESLVWVRETDENTPENSIVNTIAELKQSGQWPPQCLESTLPEELEDLGGNAAKDQDAKMDVTLDHPEFVFVSFIMRKFLKIAYFRIQAICKLLKIPMDYPVTSQVWLAFRYFLRNHVELLYGRHMDQWILCTVYGICKTMKYEPPITFARIIDVYVDVRGKDLGTGTCQAIVRNIKILDGAGDDNDDGGGDSSQRTTKMGTIIRLYNLVFVPIMKGYLLHSKSLRRNAGGLRKAIASKGSLPANSAGGNAASPDQNVGPVSVSVREGNVSIQVTLDSSDSSGNVGMKSTQMMMIDQQQNDLTQEHIPGALPDVRGEYRTFLRFGRATGAKSISLANDLIAHGTAQ